MLKDKPTGAKFDSYPIMYFHIPLRHCLQICVIVVSAIIFDLVSDVSTLLIPGCGIIKGNMLASFEKHFCYIHVYRNMLASAVKPFHLED